MIKSVFIKYILAFLAIISISFMILASITSSSVIQYSIDAQKDAMATAARLAKQNIETGFNNSLSGTFAEYAESSKTNIQWALSAYVTLIEDSFIIVTDIDGKIIVTTTLPFPAEAYLEKDHVSNEIINNILNEIEIADFQTLDGVFSLRHSVSPQLLASKSDEIYGVVFFCSTSVMANTFVRNIVNTIVLSCLWILVATMVVVYFITEKVISPVRMISRAAKSFAQGRFDVRVPVKGVTDEIGELAATFNSMAATLAVNEENQRTFLSNVSHDLRTPMTTIGGFVDGILDGTIPPDQHEFYLNIVSKDVKRLSRLVSSLFELTRIQAGERKFNSAAFDICETARLVIISLGQKMDEKNIEFEFEYDEEKTYAFADSDAIHQVLSNLLENAIKFTPEKGLVKIKITENPKDKKIYASVYNTGTGIPAEHLPYIFDRFYKSDESRGLDKTGAGLGLYIVKTIVEAHGEKIWAVSEYEKYCEFTFTLQKSPEPAGKNKN